VARIRTKEDQLWVGQRQQSLDLVARLDHGAHVVVKAAAHALAQRNLGDPVERICELAQLLLCQPILLPDVAGRLSAGAATGHHPVRAARRDVQLRQTGLAREGREVARLLLYRIALLDIPEGGAEVAGRRPQAVSSVPRNHLLGRTATVRSRRRPLIPSLRDLCQYLLLSRPWLAALVRGRRPGNLPASHQDLSHCACPPCANPLLRATFDTHRLCSLWP
jgi:hypothetical protein